MNILSWENILVGSWVVYQCSSECMSTLAQNFSLDTMNLVHMEKVCKDSQDLFGLVSLMMKTFRTLQKNKNCNHILYSYDLLYSIEQTDHQKNLGDNYKWDYDSQRYILHQIRTFLDTDRCIFHFRKLYPKNSHCLQHIQVCMKEVNRDILVNMSRRHALQKFYKNYKDHRVKGDMDWLEVNNLKM